MGKKKVIIKTKRVLGTDGKYHKKAISVNGKKVATNSNGRKISLYEIQKDGIKLSAQKDHQSFPHHVFPNVIRELIQEAYRIVSFPSESQLNNLNDGNSKK